MENFIFDTFNEKINTFSDNTFEILLKSKEYIREHQLYHYTSLEALQAIIKNESLRASSIYMMNDPNELIYGHEHISNWFNGDISNKLDNKIQNRSFNGFSAFVFSLSELNDDMHQWEKYGNNHKGIRIGFTPKNLIEYWGKLDNITVVLTPVIYHDYGKFYLDPYGKEFIKFKNEFAETISNHFIENDLTGKDLQQLAFCTSLLASQIKRKEWSSEREWRIICIAQGAYNKNIIGDFNNGKASVKIENKCRETLKMLTNDGRASKDILKIGCHAGDKEYVKYVIELLLKKRPRMNISQSDIQTR